MKNILITGISSGLGKELQILLKERGCNVFCISSSKNVDLHIDLTNIKNLQIVKDFIATNQINCLINNAGLYQKTNFVDLTDEEIQKIINVNLLSPIILTKYLYQYLHSNNKEGIIVNINSIAAKQPNFSEAVYAATKSGLGAFGTALSINQKKSKIKVIDCYLSAFKSNMTINRQNFNDLIDTSEVAKCISDLIFTGNKGMVTSFEYRGI